MIELKNVNKFYNANGITNLGLRNINLELNKNEIVAITGDSGSGKSTLLNVITKIDTFDEGEIYYKGNETSYFSISDMDDFRKNKVGFIFQNYNIIDSYTVLENVMVPLLLQGYSKKEARKKALVLIERVGLKDRFKNRGSKLSGGEKQRCVIARALASDCEILACDEPTGNLDSKTGKEIIELIKEISKDKLVLIVTHDYSLVENIVTRKIRLSDGEVVEDTKFVKVEKEEDEVLDLDYKPISKKIKFKIAKNNVLFTPKKTIFTSAVFFVIFFITLFLFQFSIYSNQALNVNNPYKNKQNDRLYVYTKDKTQIDIDDIKSITDNYVINPFFEDESISFEISNDNDRLNINCLYSLYPKDYKLIDGKLPENDSEVLFIIPNNSMTDYELIKDYTTLTFANNKYKISGFAKSSSITQCMIGYSSKLSKDLLLSTEINISVTSDNLITIQPINSDVEKLTLVFPNSYKEIINDIEISIEIEGIYHYSDYVIEYSDDPYIQAKCNYKKILTENVFEVSIYEANTAKIKNKLNSLGYEVDIPSKLDVGDDLLTFMSNLYGYLTIFMSCCLLVIVFFITYFILSKIYSSKKNDYEILRTLGVTQKDMKTIVNYEVFIVGCTGLVLGFIIAFILMLLIPSINILLPIKFLTFVIYILVCLFFIYKIAHRFNKKLFKFSVIASLKGDDFFD